MESVEKNVFELKAQIQLRLSEKNYEQLVTHIIKLKKEIRSIKKNAASIKDVEKKAHIDNIRITADGFITSVVTGLNNDFTELFNFCYELRKQDNNDEFTYELLNGPVKPAILVDIIVNNIWVKSNQRMGHRRNQSFRLVINIG